MAVAIAKAAPALMPRRPGSASGLRVSPCMQAPASPNAPPTARPRRVRSQRFTRTAWSTWAGSRSAHGEVVVEPIRTEPTTTAASVADRTATLTARAGRTPVARVPADPTAVVVGWRSGTVTVDRGSHVGDVVLHRVG